MACQKSFEKLQKHLMRYIFRHCHANQKPLTRIRKENWILFISPLNFHWKQWARILQFRWHFHIRRRQRTALKPFFGLQPVLALRLTHITAPSLLPVIHRSSRWVGKFQKYCKSLFFFFKVPMYWTTAAELNPQEGKISSHRLTAMRNIFLRDGLTDCRKKWMCNFHSSRTCAEEKTFTSCTSHAHHISVQSQLLSTVGAAVYANHWCTDTEV